MMKEYQYRPLPKLFISMSRPNSIIGCQLKYWGMIRIEGSLDVCCRMARESIFLEFIFALILRKCNSLSKGLLQLFKKDFMQIPL